MATDNRNTQGAPPAAVHVGPEHKRANWLPWLLLALGVLALIWFLARRGDRDREVAATPAVTADAPVMGTTTPATVAPPPTTAAGAGAVTPEGEPIGGLGAYLEGEAPAPRTFVFDTVNFDTARADIRPADRATIAEVAQVLQRFPNARARIVGFADAQGDAAANEGLGLRRAEAMKAALVAQGVGAERLETGTGGESAPVETNATAAGRFENRRTEFVITAR